MMNIGGSATIKPPVSFWAVSIVSLLWNAFGGYDYTMTMSHNTAYLSQMGDAGEIIAWVESFPLWATVAYALGIWGSVAGSLLLLVRSRHAATAFMVSFAGAVVSFAGQMMHKAPTSLDTTFAKVMPFVILAIVAFLWWFARKQIAAGILR